MSPHLSTYLFTYLPTHLPFKDPYQSTYLSIYIYIYLPSYLTTFLLPHIVHLQHLRENDARSNTYCLHLALRISVGGIFQHAGQGALERYYWPQFAGLAGNLQTDLCICIIIFVSIILCICIFVCVFEVHHMWWGGIIGRRWLAASPPV